MEGPAVGVPKCGEGLGHLGIALGLRPPLAKRACREPHLEAGSQDLSATITSREKKPLSPDVNGPKTHLNSPLELKKYFHSNQIISHRRTHIWDSWKITMMYILHSNDRKHVNRHCLPLYCGEIPQSWKREHRRLSGWKE